MFLLICAATLLKLFTAFSFVQRFTKTCLKSKIKIICWMYPEEVFLFFKHFFISPNFGTCKRIPYLSVARRKDGIIISSISLKRRNRLLATFCEVVWAGREIINLRLAVHNIIVPYQGIPKYTMRGWRFVYSYTLLWRIRTIYKLVLL